MLRGLSDFSSFSLSSDLTFVCWKINNPLMNICHSAITLPLCRDALDASGLAKADWWNCPWTFVSNNLVFPFLSFSLDYIRIARWKCYLQNKWKSILYLNEHMPYTRWHLNAVSTKFCKQREFKNYYTVCYVGTAVLFAGIMKWYLYGSGNREIRILKMDSKSQLTLYRWGLQCTCFQTSTGLEFWISCKGSLRNNVGFPL